MNVRILIADDHAAFRKTLHSILNQFDEIKVIAEAKNGEEAVRMVKQYVPNLVLMDVVMPKLNGIEATQRIHQEFSTIKILIVSMHSNQGYVEKACKRALRDMFENEFSR